MMIALVLYCWARGVRSSRAIERACVEDVACRVIAAQQRPDHATLARFVVRHERALGELFGEVLALCADAGLATVGVIASTAPRWRPTPAATARSTTSSSRGDRRGGDRDRRGRAAVLGERRGDDMPEIVGAERAAKVGCAPRASGLISSARAPRAGPALAAPPAAGGQATGSRRSWRSSGAATSGRGLSGPRRDEERPPLRLSAEALHAAGHARGQGQPHRPRLQAGARDARLGAGLRRPSRACNEQQLNVAAEVMTASPDFDLRQHQAQPPLHQIPQTRPSRSPNRVASHRDNTQPAQAPPALHRCHQLTAAAARRHQTPMPPQTALATVKRQYTAARPT